MKTRPGQWAQAQRHNQGSVLFLRHMWRDIPISNKVGKLSVTLFHLTVSILLLGLETKNYGSGESNTSCHFRGDSDAHEAT